MSNFHNFRDLAHSHDGKARKFNQKKGLRAHWKVMTGATAQAGICAGLCIVYLATERKSSLKDLSKQKGADTDAALMLFAEKIAQFGGNYSEGIKGLDLAFKLMTLQRKSSILQCGTPQKLGKFAVKSKSGRSFVMLRGHACAVSIHKSNDKDTYEFFDPNLGFARMPDSLKFVLFVGEFLKLMPYGTTVLELVWTD